MKISGKGRRIVLGPGIAVFVGGLAVCAPTPPSNGALVEFLGGGLLVVAGIVIAVGGAWVALIYPDTLARLMHPERQARAEEVTYLLAPMYYSALTVGVALICEFVYATGSPAPFGTVGAAAVNRAFFGLSTSLVWLQIWSLICLVAPGDFVARRLSHHESEQRYLRGNMIGSRPATPDEIHRSGLG